MTDMLSKDAVTGICVLARICTCTHVCTHGCTQEAAERLAEAVAARLELEVRPPTQMHGHIHCSLAQDMHTHSTCDVPATHVPARTASWLMAHRLFSRRHSILATACLVYDRASLLKCWPGTLAGRVGGRGCGV